MTETKLCFQGKDRQYFRVNFIKLITDHCLTVLMLTVESKIISASAPTDGLEQGPAVLCGHAASKAALPSRMLDKISRRNFWQEFSLLKAKSKINWEVSWLDWGVVDSGELYGGDLGLSMTVNPQSGGPLSHAQGRDDLSAVVCPRGL